MCGIAGIIGENTNKYKLKDVLNKIKHRGPDGTGEWENEHCRLGHVRLSIIDLTDNASQPMICAFSNNVIIFNGEIYNYIELKKELQYDYAFKTTSDTEVILAAYLKWGIKALTKLRGMFSFALYDYSKQAVLIVRDRLGIKPFYYKMNQGNFVFASEIKALLGIDTIQHRPALKQLIRFESFRQLDVTTETCFENIFQLPPASYSWVNFSGQLSTIKSYWNLPEKFGTIPFDKIQEIKLKNKIIETINIHLRADVKIGSFVSGGLDSSSIACVAAQLLGNDYDLNTFSYILKQKNEENENIDAAIERIKGENFKLEYNGEDFFDILPKITYQHDEPLPDASMLIHYKLSELAKRNGVKVMLSGSGGDEIFGGYQSHTYAYFGALLKQLKISKFVYSISKFELSAYESKSNIILKAIQEASPFYIKERLKQNVMRKKMQYWKEEILTNDIVFYPSKNPNPWMANYLNYFMGWTVPPFLHYEDRNSMANGIEIRVPFLDHELLEFTTQYKPEDIIKGISKNVLRKSMKGIVPDVILNEKSKHGFPAPLLVYTRYNKHKSKEFFMENVKKVPFFNSQSAEKIVNNYLDLNDVNMLDDFWRMMSISVWYNCYF